MLLLTAQPDVAVALEQIDAVMAQTALFGIFRAPDAVGVLRFVQKDLAVQSAQLIGRVDVEQEQPMRLQHRENAPERLLKVGRLRHIVHAVQTAHRRVHRVRQPQPLHFLADPERRLRKRQLHAFFAGHRQHFLRTVNAQHAVALLRQQQGQRSGAARQIQNGLGLNTGSLEHSFKKSCDLRVGDVVGQRVVGKRQRLIRAHAFSSLSNRSKMV